MQAIQLEPAASSWCQRENVTLLSGFTVFLLSSVPLALANGQAALDDLGAPLPAFGRPAMLLGLTLAPIGAG